MTEVLGTALPEGWTASRLKRVTSLLNRGSAPDYVDHGPVRAISQAANQPGGLDWARTRFHDATGDPRRLKGYLLLEDILINSTGTGTLGRIGYFQGGPDGIPCMADTHVTVARAIPSEVDSRFLYYWLTSIPFQEYIYAALVVGATNQIELNRDRLGDAPVPIPPAEEQRKISSFLDAEIDRIDDVIIERTRQLALLSERELASVVHAVRGASQPGERKESGLAWMGSVPEVWAVAAVSHHYEVLLGKMLNQERVEGDHLRPYLRNTNVQWGSIETHDLLQMNFPPGERSRYEVRVGDLLICEGGEPGRSAIWQGEVEEIFYQKALHRARPRSESSVRWLYYCMRAATALNVFAVEGNTTTISHLTGEQLRVLRFPFPPREVQDRITSELDEKVRLLRDLASRVREQLVLLAERRRTLITAAVTGQIDVTTARGVRVP
ncbi:restriction endonuclease subunit S [Streptomyces sp. NPDC048142]|uniref:restriction endonuclease subunit S n=1 Tax=Streptomyces sp. NPDC048142 TaxID=3365501 RepID=UPI003712D032